MSIPDYLVCLECDTPVYTFEFRNDKLYEIVCPRCGNEDPELYIDPIEADELDSTWDRKTGRAQRERLRQRRRRG